MFCICSGAFVQNVFGSDNIYHAKVEIRTEELVCVFVTCPVLSDFNQNLYIYRQIQVNSSPPPPISYFSVRLAVVKRGQKYTTNINGRYV